MKQFLLKLFTWWNGQTFGTQLWTWRFGELVGQDEQGNRYYRTSGGKIDPTLGFERRWVIYNGYAEASRIPPSWHGWMHHTVDLPPTEEKYVPREWEKPHVPNMTGTPAAYRPSGSTLAAAAVPRPPATTSPGPPATEPRRRALCVMAFFACRCIRISACEQREQRGRRLWRPCSLRDIAAQ